MADYGQLYLDFLLQQKSHPAVQDKFEKQKMLFYILFKQTTDSGGNK